MEKSDVQKYIDKLKELDNQLSDFDESTNEENFMEELNKVLLSLSNDMYNEPSVKSVLQKEIRFINESNNPDPEFAHEGDSGFDLRAFIDTELVAIPPGKVKIIPTGIYVEIEKGLEVQIRSRSGMAANQSLFVLNSPGTIDSHYRGEIKIILANFSEIYAYIRNGDRIAQGVVCPVYGEGFLSLKKVEKLSETVRNTNGLGSTGIS